MDFLNSNPNRIDILRILKSEGPLPYSNLKSQSGFNTEKASGKFAYHLKKLLNQSLVAFNKSQKRYSMTELGKVVLKLAEKIKEKRTKTNLIQDSSEN